MKGAPGWSNRSNKKSAEKILRAYFLFLFANRLAAGATLGTLRTIPASLAVIFAAGTVLGTAPFLIVRAARTDFFGIIAGNPGKLIGYRYKDKEIIELIQKIKWWDWSEKKIIDNRNIFTLEENELKEELLKLDS